MLEEQLDGQRSTTPATARRRVLHVINGEHFAGAERVQDLLALQLPACGFDAAFACLKPDQFPDLRRSQDSPLYEAPMRGRFDLWPARALAELVRDEGYALIHTHTARSVLVGALAAHWARVPMVHHVHSPAVADTTNRLKNWLNAATERFSVRQAAAVITVSESLARYVVESRLNRREPIVVPNGVPTPGPLSKRTTPAGRWTLGMIALFRPRKGLEVLLEAVAELVGRGHDLQLRAVGGFETPAYEADVRALAERLGVARRIDWRGFQKNVDAELHAMDLFILPSLFGEGMPMVVLEAMAAGIPVVGTRVEGTPEVVRDGIDGLIAEPRDAKSLASAIERCVTGQVDWQALRTSAYERQTTRFSDSSMARGVAEVYRQLLDK
jgi:glycosyltransferase involved in cell wall biosynthesis